MRAVWAKPISKVMRAVWAKPISKGLTLVNWASADLLAMWFGGVLVSHLG